MSSFLLHKRETPKNPIISNSPFQIQTFSRGWITPRADSCKRWRYGATQFLQIQIIPPGPISCRRPVKEDINIFLDQKWTNITQSKLQRLIHKGHNVLFNSLLIFFKLFFQKYQKNMIARFDYFSFSCSLNFDWNSQPDARNVARRRKAHIAGAERSSWAHPLLTIWHFVRWICWNMVRWICSENRTTQFVLNLCRC